MSTASATRKKVIWAGYIIFKIKSRNINSHSLHCHYLLEETGSTFPTKHRGVFLEGKHVSRHAATLAALSITPGLVSMLCVLVSWGLSFSDSCVLFELSGVAAVVRLCVRPSRLHEQHGSWCIEIFLTGHTSAAAQWAHAHIYYWAAGSQYSYQWGSIHSADKPPWVCLSDTNLLMMAHRCR